jgi:hypothetical protein
MINTSGAKETAKRSSLANKPSLSKSQPLLMKLLDLS